MGINRKKCVDDINQVKVKVIIQSFLFIHSVDFFFSNEEIALFQAL